MEYQLIDMDRLKAPYMETGLAEELTDMCNNQQIRTTAAVQNFSVLATGLVLVFCLATITTATCLPTCVQRCQARRTRKGRDLSHAAEAGRLARLADEKYHLLAMALRDAPGVTDWHRGKGDIPITDAFPVPQPALEKGLVQYSRSDPKVLSRNEMSACQPLPSLDSTLVHCDSMSGCDQANESVVETSKGNVEDAGNTTPNVLEPMGERSSRSESSSEVPHGIDEVLAADISQVHLPS